MSDFLGGIGGFFGDIGDWFSNTAGSVFGNGGDDLSGLGDVNPEGTGYIDDWSNPEIVGGGDDFNYGTSGYDEFARPDEAITPQGDWSHPEIVPGGASNGLGSLGGSAASQAASSAGQSGLWKTASGIIGKTATSLLGPNGALSGSGSGSSTINNILNSASKLPPMATPSTPAALGRSSGPAATVNGTDAVTAWTKLFSGDR